MDDLVQRLQQVILPGIVVRVERHPVRVLAGAQVEVDERQVAGRETLGQLRVAQHELAVFHIHRCQAGHFRQQFDPQLVEQVRHFLRDLAEAVLHFFRHGIQLVRGAHIRHAAVQLQPGVLVGDVFGGQLHRQGQVDSHRQRELLDDKEVVPAVIRQAAQLALHLDRR